jgi:hypothetical protein
VINSLSLVLVIVAAVTLALGWFQDGLALVYVSIVTCLVALALIGVDRLLRRRAPVAAAAGYATVPAGAAPVARPSATPGTGAHDDVGDDGDDGDDDPDPVATRSSSAAAVRDPRGSAVVGTRTHRRVADEERAVRGATSRRGVARRPTAPDAPGGTATDVSDVSDVTEATETRSVSELEQVRGLGPAKRGALLERFGSVEAIAAATPDELSRTPGIGAGLARAIKDQLG